jgi:RNA polymerase sigma-32 factor
MTAQPSDRHFSAYLRKIYALPLLSPEEEYRLAKRWRENQDYAAVERLVTSHLRLVTKVARGYRGYGFPFPDLVSEGSVGMMQAVKRFDPERGCRLSSYAVWWIHAAMQDYILHSWSFVKIGTTAAQKKLFFNLNRLKRQFDAATNGDLSKTQIAAIAAELNVSEQDVLVMNRRLSGRDESLNTHVADSQTSLTVERQDLILDDTPDQEAIIMQRSEASHRRRLLDGALSRLSSREREIVNERHLKDRAPTLRDLGERYGVSRESVRLIEERSLAKLRRAVRPRIESAPLTIGGTSR